MYTIIACTNREGSNTLKLANLYKNLFTQEGIDAQLFSLQDIDMLQRNARFEELEKQYLIPTDKFIFIVPEYNGSFPGIMKLMIDLSDIKPCWNHKKVLLTGLAAGRAGNLRGLDVLTNMCHYMHMNVHPMKIPLSSIHNEIDENGFRHDTTKETVLTQIKNFINY